MDAKSVCHRLYFCSVGAWGRGSLRRVKKMQSVISTVKCPVLVEEMRCCVFIWFLGSPHLMN